MLVNAVLCGFFRMNEQAQQGIVLDHLCDDLLYFLSDDTDLNAASDNIGINNAIIQIPFSPVQLFLLFLCFCLLLVIIELVVVLGAAILG